MGALGVVAMATACGRVSFDARDGALDDAPLTADASTLVTCAVAAAAPPTLTVTGKTFRYTSFANTWAAVPNMTVRALTAVNGGLLAQVASDAAGDFAIPVATGGQSIPVVFEVSGGSYFTTVLSPDLPFDADVTAPALTTNDVFSAGDAPVWDTGAIQLIYDQLAIVRDNAKGSLNVAVRDCAGQPVFGVTVELEPPPDVLRYQAPDGTASTTLTSTDAPFGHALAYNVPPGTVRVIARKDGVVVADQDVEVRGGMVYTVATVRGRM